MKSSTSETGLIVLTKLNMTILSKRRTNESGLVYISYTITQALFNLYCRQLYKTSFSANILKFTGVFSRFESTQQLHINLSISITPLLKIPALCS